MSKSSKIAVILGLTLATALAVPYGPRESHGRHHGSFHYDEPHVIRGSYEHHGSHGSHESPRCSCAQSYGTQRSYGPSQSSANYENGQLYAATLGGSSRQNGYNTVITAGYENDLINRPQIDNRRAHYQEIHVQSVATPPSGADSNYQLTSHQSPASYGSVSIENSGYGNAPRPHPRPCSCGSNSGNSGSAHWSGSSSY